MRSMMLHLRASSLPKTFLVTAFVLLTSSGIGASNAQSPNSISWDVETAAELAPPTVQLIKQGGVVDTVPLSRIRLLRDVKRRIEKQAGFTASFSLTDLGMPNPNAFSTRNENGALVAINLSMFNLLGDDMDALAAVIGHEYAHIALNHRDARNDREVARQGISEVLGFILGRAGVPMAGTLSSLGTTMVSRTFSRDEEREADEKGMHYAAAAGFSAGGGIRAWEQMARTGSSDSFPFLATHPTSAERIETMRQLARTYFQNVPHSVAANKTDEPASSGTPEATYSAATVARAAQSTTAAEVRVPEIAGYEVGRGDTLLGIARKTKHASVTVNQMLIAIYNANRSSFAGDNPRAMTLGMILAIPNKDEVATINRAEADRLVREYLARWAAAPPPAPAALSE